ncbi:MAG: glutaminyl-peptide cyclotransferase [Candidatus Krumholzibacteria bacterium]|nr:glutaminyl-peptide cyclotransferase [Candidatus Krumholzibacteria bacterium]
MRKFLSTVTIISAILASSCSESEGPRVTDPGNTTETRYYTYNVVAEFMHDADAFTQGLVYDNGVLYEGTGLRAGESTLRRVDLPTGRVVDKITIGPFFGEGIAVVNDKIYQLTWTDGLCFVWDKSRFSKLGEFRYSGEGWGLTYDGNRLIMSDGSATLYFRDPDTFEITGSVLVRDEHDQEVQRLNELEYIDGEIYANVWKDYRIARISPRTGRVVAWLDLTGIHLNQGESVLNGIAYDASGGRLFVTGKLWPKLFEVEQVLIEE